MHLLDLLFPPREDEAALRAVERETFLSRLSPMLVPGTDPAVAALLPYADPAVKAAIHEAKYHGSEPAFDLLSAALAEYLSGGDWFGTLVLVPVPLSKERLRERGFNQAEEIARRACRDIGIDVASHLIKRVRDTASQVTLSGHARRENMRGAFAPAGPASSAVTYILFDDVVTTGATLGAAAEALRQAGALHVSPIALAH